MIASRTVSMICQVSAVMLPLPGPLSGIKALVILENRLNRSFSEADAVLGRYLTRSPIQRRVPRPRANRMHP